MKEEVEECKLELRKVDAKGVRTGVSLRVISTSKYKYLSAQRRPGIESLSTICN